MPECCAQAHCSHMHAHTCTCTGARVQASSGSSYSSSSPSRATGGSNDSLKASVEASLEKLSAPALKTLISSQGGYYGAGIGPGALRELAVEVLSRGSWERAAELVAAAEAKVSNVVLAMQWYESGRLDVRIGSHIHMSVRLSSCCCCAFVCEPTG